MDMMCLLFPTQYLPSIEKGFRASLEKGPLARLSGGEIEYLGGRWFVSHGGQFGLGVSDLCADGTAGDVSSHEANAIGAGDEVGDRMSESISRRRSRRFEFSSRLDNGMPSSFQPGKRIPTAPL